jgi:hypothetical protein
VFVVIERHNSKHAQKICKQPTETMELNKIKQARLIEEQYNNKDHLMETETTIITLIGLLIAEGIRYGGNAMPYNDLELTGANYTLAILQGNP